MQNPIRKKYQHFFAHSTKDGIQASFADTSGRKNYRIPNSNISEEEAPLAIESFSVSPEEYHSLMERVSALYKNKKASR
jgi:hypothetical protein|tara:strand:+ start:96 stop:332 length:237 start_codon:yes stop_codon:yes gene_type:complete